MKKIYVILVAYNPDIYELEKAIERLKKQTNIVIICNNSVFDLEFEDKQLKVFNFNNNLGIAKAQSIGMKWAFENGADFILQMDQDSVPDEKLVENLLYCYNELTQKGYKVGLVGSQDFDKDTKEYSKALINKGTQIKNTQYYLVSDILSSGSLIPKEIYDLIGGMDDDLFIDIVDFEYCWRVLSKDYLVVKNINALIAHKLGDGKTKLFGCFNINIGSPFRHYYQFRNILYMMNRKYVPFKWKISQLIKLLSKLILYPLGLKDGIVRFSYMIKGIKDFLKNKKGMLK